MATEIAIAEAIYVICILFASLSFSPSSSRTSTTNSIFGDGLARPFHQLFFVVCCTLTMRSFLLRDQRFVPTSCNVDATEEDCKQTVFSVFLYYSWVAIESILISFLKLCMPYLLLRHMATFINTTPSTLQSWLMVVCGMELVGVILAGQISPNFWSIKRFGDGILVLPRIQTLQTYQSIVMARHNSQPSLLVDTLIQLEKCLLVTIVGASVSYAIEDHQNPNTWLVAIKMVSIFLGYTVLIFHSILLKCLDQQHQDVDDQQDVDALAVAPLYPY